MTGLLSLVSRQKSVAVIGLAKNTGKTVTVNHLIAEAGKVGLRLGLTSTGRDGETTDILSTLPKPSLNLPADAVLATAAASLTRGTARLEILDATGTYNALGEIVLARVREAGTVEISGPERTADLKSVKSKLERLADLIIVDGALDRMAASAPSVTQACILATGAVIGRDIGAVVSTTVHCAKVLTIPVAPSLPVEAAALLEKGETGVMSQGGETKKLPLLTAVDAPVEILEYLDEGFSTLLIGGALTDELADLLVTASRSVSGLQAVVRDGTRIFVAADRWQRLLRTGTLIKALEPVNLIAVTVNPVDPRGRQLPGDLLINALRDLLPGLLIIDPLAVGGM